MTGFWSRLWAAFTNPEPLAHPTGPIAVQPEKPPEPAAPFPSALLVITPEMLRRCFPRTGRLEEWAPALRAAMARYDITTPHRMAYFLAQLGVESVELSRLSESLNYRVGALWPKFDNRGMTAALANELGRKEGEDALSEERQRDIANIIYGGEWGRKNLGNTGPNDGWNFRGAGAIQTTGRSNHQALADAFNLGPAENARPWLLTIPGAAMGAAFFWNSRRLNSFADQKDFVEVCRRVQGNTSTVGERQAMLSWVVSQMGLQGSPGAGTPSLSA